MLKDDNYEIINPEPDGNCLFYSFQKGFQSVGLTTTVEQLRLLQDPFITPEKFDTLISIVSPYHKENMIKLNRVKELAREYNLKKSTSSTSPADRRELMGIYEKYQKAISDMNKQLKTNPIPDDSRCWIFT